MTGVAVAGGGPAGLAAAIFAARAGAGVTLLEANDRCGVKLLATGGGHCNLANLRPPGEWPALFGRRGRFILPALDFLSREKLCDWLESLGVPVASPDGIHLFPVSRKAADVQAALVAEAARLGVDIRYGRRVDGLTLDEQGTALAGLRRGAEAFPCRRTVIAVGGNSMPATGSAGDGMALAKLAGHRVSGPYPGLVGLRAANLDPALAGLILPDAETQFHIKGRPAARGEKELLLTHGGVSGPAVLDLSASVAEALAAAGGQGVTLVIRWKAGMDERVWAAELDRRRAAAGALPVVSLFREHVPQRLAHWLCGVAGVPPDRTFAAVKADERNRLAAAFGAFAAEITGTEGWDKAMITRGGVDVTEVDPRTMASRLAAGLYFAGETLDVDGPCGGYNLHWAFASGALAGWSAGVMAARA